MTWVSDVYELQELWEMMPCGIDSYLVVVRNSIYLVSNSPSPNTL